MNLNEIIEVPAEYVDFCAVWHDDQWSAMFSVYFTERIALKDMNHLYCEIEPTYVYDSIDGDNVTYEDHLLSVRFRNWTLSFLTDEWWDAMDAASAALTH